MDPGESCDVLRAILASTTIDHIAGKATLEGMPTEVHWQILRSFLKSSEPVILRPQDTYTNCDYHFGSLGILRVSKYFSVIGLSILYGENSFSIEDRKLHLEESDEYMEDSNVEGPVSFPTIILRLLLRRLTFLTSSHMSISSLFVGVL